MPNEHKEPGKNNTFSSLRELQTQQNVEHQRGQEFEKILKEFGEKLTLVFANVTPATLIPNVNEYTDDTDLKATASLLRIGLTTFIEDCKKINTLTKIYEKMQIKGMSLGDGKKIHFETEFNAALKLFLDNVANIHSLFDPTIQAQPYIQKYPSDFRKPEALSKLVGQIKEQHEWLISLNKDGMQDLAQKLEELGIWFKEINNKVTLSNESKQLLNTISSHCETLNTKLQPQGLKEKPF
jgi:hypothetical protein